MNKIERYSLHSGLKISEPFINDCFFPIVHDKYICFAIESDVNSKKYDYWQEVINLIYRPLLEKGIKIIQIGDEKSRPMDRVYSARGLASFNQESYIIKKSILYFGSDGHHIHLSALHNKPFVSLYSHELSCATKPHWESDSNYVLIDSPKEEGKTASLNLSENPKSINKISPFKIAENILDLLNIDNDLKNFELVHVGENFHIPTVEIVPDFEPSPNFLNNSLVNVRMDLSHNENNLFLLSRGRKLGIIANKPISINCLASIKDSVAKIFVELSEDIPDEFIKNLKNLNIDYSLFSRDDDALSGLRIKYIEDTIEHFKTKTKKSLDKLDKICDTSLVKSSKIIISNGKKYLTIAHWIMDQPHKGKDQQILDTSDFWIDSDYYLIYNKGNKNAKGKTKGKQEQIDHHIA